MEITFNQTIDASFDDASTNTSKIGFTVKGGSNTDLYKPADADAPASNFYVKGVEQFKFVLGKTNNFSQEMLSLLKTPLDKITGISIYSYHTTNGKAQSPVRFDLSLKMNTMVAALKLSNMSAFQILNLTSPNFTELLIDNVKVPDENGEVIKEANLVVIVCSSNENQP